jgi:hypothetical protein
MTTRQSREPLPQVAAFIRSIHSDRSGQPAPDNGIWFSRRDEGSVFLDAERAVVYSRVVTELMKKYAPREDVSRRTVEGFLQEAVFEALDIQSRSTSSFDDRLRAALDKLLARLRAPSEVYRCWVPIEGLKLDRRAARFGPVTFAKFGPRQLRELTQRNPAKGRLGWPQILKHVRESKAWGRVCSVVEVEARDSESAEALALRRTRQILDVVNLFTDLVPYNYAWLYLPGEAASSLTSVPTLTRAGAFSVPLTRIEPVGNVSWKAVREAKHIAKAFRGLDRLARAAEGRDTCGAVLLNAGQWIGRATVERRREEAFLLYTIALETMLLPMQAQELGYRLRLRAAHVLGKTIAARERIAADVSTLYTVRSKIAHAGSYQVTDEELGRLRSYVKGTLFRLVTTPKIHAMTRQQLDAWLEGKLLR